MRNVFLRAHRVSEYRNVRYISCGKLYLMRTTPAPEVAKTKSHTGRRQGRFRALRTLFKMTKVLVRSRPRSRGRQRQPRPLASRKFLWQARRKYEYVQLSGREAGDGNFSAMFSDLTYGSVMHRPRVFYLGIKLGFSLLPDINLYQTLTRRANLMFPKFYVPLCYYRVISITIHCHGLTARFRDSNPLGKLSFENANYPAKSSGHSMSNARRKPA